MGYSGFSWYFDDARLEVTESIVGSMVDSANSLYPWWRNLGRTLIDTTTLTLSLGFLSLLTAVLSYLVVSRRLRDSYLTLAIWVIPEWITAVTTWIMALSRVAQEYALLGSQIPAIRTGVDAAARCLTGMDCVRVAVDPQPKPVYISHGCVGTGLLAANALIQEGVLCALVFFYILRDHQHGKLMRSIVVAPYLAACVSAAINVQKVCWPGDIILESGLRIQRQWSVFAPHGIDPTTGKLTQISHMIVLGVMALWVWQYRQAFLAQLSGNTEYGYAWIRPLLIMNAVPPAVLTGLRYLNTAYSEGRDSPVWVYALFSVAYSFVPPLMGMWPGLMLILNRLTLPDTILPITQEKDDIGAVLSTPNFVTGGVTDSKVDHSAAVETDAAKAAHSQVFEKSAGFQ